MSGRQTCCYGDSHLDSSKHVTIDTAGEICRQYCNVHNTGTQKVHGSVDRFAGKHVKFQGKTILQSLCESGGVGPAKLNSRRYVCL